MYKYIGNNQFFYDLGLFCLQILLLMVMDHLIYSNPHDRFLIMILERLEAVENAINSFQTNMTCNIAALNDKQSHSVINLKLGGLIEEKYNNICECLKVLGCTMFFFGEDNLQTLVVDNKYLVMLEDISKDLTKHGVRLNSLSIESKIDLEKVTWIVNNQKQYNVCRR